MKIRLSETGKNQYYFIVSANFTACTSGGFSIIFNLDVNLYNKLLIDKVIKHNKYEINPGTKDLTFDLNDISKDIYINRFKETFIDELTLIALGGAEC